MVQQVRPLPIMQATYMGAGLCPFPIQLSANGGQKPTEDNPSSWAPGM